MGKDKPLVSVVVPAYNAGKTIHLMAKSVLDQTFENVELIVCDDNSTDDTVKVLEGLRDDRIVIVRNRKNLGEGLSRDRAISLARGKWVAMLDADDAWLPRRLDEMLRVSNLASDVMVFDDIFECRHSYGRLLPWRRLRGPAAFGSSGQAVDVSSADWARSKRLLIKPIIPSGFLRNSGVKHTARTYAADTEFFLKLVSGGIKLRYTPEAYYLYRQGAPSASRTRSRHVQMLEVLNESKGLFLDMPDMLDALRRRIAYERHLERYFRFIWALRDGDRGQALMLALGHPRILFELLTRGIRETASRHCSDSVLGGGET